MKRVLSLILLFSILLVMLISCNKTTDQTGNNTDVSTIIPTTSIVIIHDPVPPSEDEYQNNNIQSFISEWKKQQSVSENEGIRYDWKSIDGSPESSLLVPKSISEDYIFAEVRADRVEYHNYHRGYTSYSYYFVNEKEDYYNAIAFSVVKGNRNYDVFHKEELTYEDLEFFVNEFVMREECDCYSCTRDQNRTNISMQTDNAVCVEYPSLEAWYTLYNGQIICVSSNDKSLMNLPEDIFDYITLEEITLD